MSRTTCSDATTMPDRKPVVHPFSFKRGLSLIVILATGFALGLIFATGNYPEGQSTAQAQSKKLKKFDDQIDQNSQRMMEEGRDTFRSDTFGDEAFWGNTLKLHQAIAGSNLGGVGPGVSPKAALDLGLKVDIDAVPKSVARDLARGRLD